MSVPADHGYLVGPRVGDFWRTQLDGGFTRIVFVGKICKSTSACPAAYLGAHTHVYTVNTRRRKLERYRTLMLRRFNHQTSGYALYHRPSDLTELPDELVGVLND